MATEPDPSFEALLSYLKESRGFDFTGYKRASLTRRVHRRMEQIGIADVGDYLDHLQVHPNEFTALFDTILVNVTEFFRDPEVWEHLRLDIVPALLAGKGPSEPIRVWAAGCASGEEAYTLAIVLAEAIGIEDVRDRVKIYATDVDDNALAQGRQGSYGPREIRNVPAELLQKYFEVQGQHYIFSKYLRRAVIFGRNDLVQDAPISRIDLLVCRNVLMYLNAETQGRIIRRFHFALAPGGLLFLGRAEMLLGHSPLFTPVDVRRRFFRKVNGRRSIPDMAALAADDPALDETALALQALREEAMLAAPAPHIVVTADGRVAMVSRQAEFLFGVSSRDVGRQLRDLEISYRPAELRGYIEQARLDRHTVRVRDLEWMRGPDLVRLEIQLTPLVDRDANYLGVSIVFQDVTDEWRLRVELEQTNRQLETAYEELQSTNEELETTNEELQSTVEELETTNEELQSTNEELETMNEELQSTNDELQAINDELRERTDEIHDANSFLEAVLTGLRAGIAVLDRDLQIRVWNRHAEDLWGLRSDEAVGRPFLSLNIGLPVRQLSPEVLQVVSDEGDGFEVVVPAVNRFGRDIGLRVVGSPLRGDGRRVRGAILAMDTLPNAESPDAEWNGKL
ncbi:MAG TPA: CheR family methyltransferase [Kineosporiaceae bacterium]